MNEQQPTSDRFMDFSEALIELKAGKKIKPSSNAGGYLWIDHEGTVRFHCPNDNTDNTVYQLPIEAIMRQGWEVVSDV